MHALSRRCIGCGRRMSVRRIHPTRQQKWCSDACQQQFKRNWRKLHQLLDWFELHDDGLITGSDRKLERSIAGPRFWHVH